MKPQDKRHDLFSWWMSRQKNILSSVHTHSEGVSRYNRTLGAVRCEASVQQMTRADPNDPFIRARVRSHFIVGIATPSDYSCEFINEHKTILSTQTRVMEEYAVKTPINMTRL